MSIYFDSASATIPDKDTLSEYLDLKSSLYASASSYHQKGLKSRALIENSREKIASKIKCLSKQLYFANSVSEVSNIVIQGVVKKRLENGKKIHMIFSSLDHVSITGFVKNEFFSKKMVQIDIVESNNKSLLDIQEYLNKIKGDTRLISFPYFSGETGVVQPLKEFLKRLNQVNQIRLSKGLESVLVYLDGASLPRYFEINLKELKVDFLAISSSKIYGVGGSSLLFIRNQNNLEKLFSGGNQESGLIPGGESVSEICALAS